MLRHQASSKRSRGGASAGFTLVEVLVALMMLTTALVPAFVLATNALALSSSIRDSLIATGLAQEGVEVVRAMRDANWFAPTYPTTTFDAGLNVCANGCRVQWNTDGTTDPILPMTNDFLKLDPLSGLYQYDKGTDTLFQRKITVTKVSPSEIAVISTVTWLERSSHRSTTVEYHLFDWIK